MPFDLAMVSLLLVLTGLVQLVVGFFSTRAIIRNLPGRRPSWTALAVLIALFACGYVSYATWLTVTEPTSIALLIAAVFAGGGTFVLVVTRLSRDSLDEARELAVSLEQERARIDDAHRRLETIFDNAAEGIVTIDESGHVESCNPAAASLFGLTRDTLVGRSVHALLESVEDRTGAIGGRADLSSPAELVGHELEAYGRHRSGRRVALSIRLRRTWSEGRALYVAILGDIEERKQLLDRLRYLAERDGATRLYNRRYFRERLAAALASLEDGAQLSLLYIDLDHFKAVNDRYGHAAGDSVLVDIAELLLANLPDTAIVARIGGDEFTAMIPAADAAQSGVMAESLRIALERYRFGMGDYRVDVGGSIGLSSVASSGRNRDRLIAQADLACRIAKRAGRNRVHAFEAADESAYAARNDELGMELRC